MDAKKIQTEGIKLLEEFSEKLKKVPESVETHYVLDMRNVWRTDGKPIHREGFRKKIEKLSPRFEEGYVIAEKGS
jgi:predicted Asp-tRNA(Asn)/Glu-tRNA(Gln) amidotransferase subunit C